MNSAGSRAGLGRGPGHDPMGELEVSMAAADLEAAASAAREAGRPITASALRAEARELELQITQLLARVSASRDGAVHD